MTLEEAIRIQKLYLDHSDQWNHQELDDAIGLAIEALKREKEYRLTRGLRTFDLLPGETKE